MKVNYILLKGGKHFKCYDLADISAHFDLSITNNRSVICDGNQDTMSYSKEWSYQDIIVDFIHNRIEKVVPGVEIYKVQK